jgi:hypothetical protein
MQNTHTNNDKPADIYSQLVAVSEEAFESAHYETAYHALSAAMHYAKDVRNEHNLNAVAQLAQVQLDWIETYAKEHWMSGQSAIKRNGINLYESLIKQINTTILFIQRQECQKQLK